MASDWFWTCRGVRSTYPDPMVKLREFSQCKIMVDDRYLPLIISTFMGRADVEAAKWHMETQNRIMLEAARKGRRVVAISDSTRSDRPDAEARKYWADSMSQTPDTIRGATLGNIVVVNSVLIRGALTAIGWLNPKAKELVTVATLQQGIEMGLELLDKAGIARPAIDPRAYEAIGNDFQKSAG